MIGFIREKIKASSFVPVIDVRLIQSACEKN